MCSHNSESCFSKPRACESGPFNYQYEGVRREVFITTYYNILTKVFMTRINFSENHMYDREFSTKFLDGIISKEDADVLVNKFFRIEGRTKQ